MVLLRSPPSHPLLLGEGGRAKPPLPWHPPCSACGDCSGSVGGDRVQGAWPLTTKKPAEKPGGPNQWISPLLCHGLPLQPRACLPAPRCLLSLPITQCGPLALHLQTGNSLGKCPGHQTRLHIPKPASHRAGTGANPKPVSLRGLILITLWLGKTSNCTRAGAGQGGCAEERASMAPSTCAHAQPRGGCRLLGPVYLMPQLE